MTPRPDGLNWRAEHDGVQRADSTCVPDAEYDGAYYALAPTASLLCSHPPYAVVTGNHPRPLHPTRLPVPVLAPDRAGGGSRACYPPSYPPSVWNRSVWSFVPRMSSAPGPLPQTGTTAPVCCWLGGSAVGAAPAPP